MQECAADGVPKEPSLGGSQNSKRASPSGTESSHGRRQECQQADGKTAFLAASVAPVEDTP